MALKILSFCDFLNFYPFGLLLPRSFFFFYAFLIFSSIFFYLPSVVSLLDLSSASTSNLQRFCRISHKVARRHFSSKSGRAFRPGGSRGVFAPYTPATGRRRALRRLASPEWFGRFSVGRVSILRPRLSSSLPLLEKHFSTVSFDSSSFWTFSTLRRPRVGV